MEDEGADEYLKLIPKKRARKPRAKLEEGADEPAQVKRPQRARTFDPNQEPFELGKILSSGMIGMVYLGRENQDKQFVCIKRMIGKKIAEKNIFQSIRRELKILHKVQKIPGCV